MGRPRVLYISYDGMLEPLGQSQVLAYLRELSRTTDIHLISFEKRSDTDVVDLRAWSHELAQAGIAWHPLTYHKSPSALATSWDILQGTVLGLWIAWRQRIEIIHARSYVASVMGLAIKRLTGAKYIFDMRGFWADERVDGGLWKPQSRMYRVAKAFERRFLLHADHVISLTHAARRELETFSYLRGRLPPLTVIPTCADLRRFRPDEGIRKEFSLGYVGSAGTWYEFDATVACFKELLRTDPAARILVVNRNEHDFIRAKLLAAGVPLEAVELRSAAHAEMPAQINRMAAAIFFVKPLYSKRASSPTKLAELLGCGIPCLSNTGVGDMAEILEDGTVGVAVDGFGSEQLASGLRRLMRLAGDQGVRERCTDAAQRHFSLANGVEQYAQVYAQLRGAPAVADMAHP